MIFCARGMAEPVRSEPSGEGTDAARMTGQYLRGRNALWTRANKEHILEMIYEKGSTTAIEYKGTAVQEGAPSHAERGVLRDQGVSAQPAECHKPGFQQVTIF